MTTEGFPGAPGHTLRIRRAAGGAPDVRAARGSQRSPMNPVRQTGDPSAAQGLYWTLPLPFRDRMPGSRTHANRTLSESYRGLSKPAGVHLNFALGLSNEVGPPHNHPRQQLPDATPHRTLQSHSPNRRPGAITTVLSTMEASGLSSQRKRTRVSSGTGIAPMSPAIRSLAGARRPPDYRLMNGDRRRISLSSSRK